MISLISEIVREYFLPNAYTNYFGTNYIADLFSIIIGGSILHFLSYNLVGCYYRKGIDHYLIGTLLYLIFYILITFLIIFISSFIHNFIITVFLFLIIYILLGIFLNHLSTKRYGVQF